MGFKQFEIATAATVKIFGSRCSFDGIFAAGSVDLSTQQTFLDEYCIHGETGLKMSGDNYFGSGTTVSTPHFENCGPTAEHCSDEVNPGFKEAFEELSQSASSAEKVGAYIDIIMNGYSGDPDLLETNAYIANLLFGYTYDPEREILNLAELPPLYPEGEKYKLHTASVKEPLDVRELEPGKINIVTCAKNGFNVELGFENEDGSEVTEPLELDGIIVVGDGCDFVFDRSVTYTNAILATNATGTQTFSGNSGVTLGENDGCKPGNEVTLITQGSVSFASKLSAYDLDVIATKNVHLASKANDPSEHIGTNINALGDVQITTKHTFRGCEGNTVSPFGQKLSYAIVQ